MWAYQLSAPKATDTFATLHTLPKQTRLLRKTARAMKPPNQNIMVTASAANSANRFAAMLGNLFRAASVRYVVVSRLKTLVKRRKLISTHMSRQ